jgi:hypothetical protein
MKDFLRWVVAFLLLCWLVVEVPFIGVVTIRLFPPFGEVQAMVGLGAWTMVGFILALCAIALR